VLEHIDANGHRGPRLSELSALAHMSPFHFARRFKESTWLPPHRFVVGRRIDHAKELRSAARVGGFRTASHFTTVFRCSTGVTPSAYRSRSCAPADAPIA